MKRISGLTLSLVLGCLAVASAQDVDNGRGRDRRVDYTALAEIAPWDDRNYDLTLEDLALLAPNEEEMLDPIPVFFRVLLRREVPKMRRTGPAQYPRSAVNVFRQRFHGFLIDGVYRTGLEYRDGRFFFLPQPRPSGRDIGEALTGEVRMTTPNGAAESAIEISPVNGNLVIAGTNGPVNGQDMHFSTNGGETWTRVAAGLPGAQTCCDPTVDWSFDGTKAYAATLGACSFLCHVFFYRSGDGGQSWTDLPGAAPQRRQVSTGAAEHDKEFLHVDRFATSPFRDQLYLTWHRNNTMQFARSTDLGNTWSVPLAFTTDPAGIGSDVSTDAAGAIYYVYPAFSPSQTIRLKKSTDGGVTFGASTTIATTNGDFDWPIPAMESRRAWIYVATAVDLSGGPFHNSIYAAWTDTSAPESGTAANNHTRIQVAFSRNGGATWTLATPHSTGDILTVDRFNQWMAVAPNGRIHVVFYSTQNSVGRTGVDMYHTFSNDGGVNWSAAERLTATTSPNIADFFEWGDYNGVSALLNQAISIYTDNRFEGGGAGDSIDVYAAGPVSVPVKLERFRVE